MRKLARTAVPVVALLAVAACGGGGSSTDGGDTPSETPTSAESSGAPTRSDADLVIWTDATAIDAVTPVADDFAEAQGITVDVQSVSSDLQTNFVTANAAGNGPDVVVGAHDWIGNLVQNGAITPLQLTADQLSGYSPKAVQAVTYDQKLYGLPFGIEALGLYRNTDLVPDEPKTLDDAIAAGKAVMKKNKAVESALNLPVGENGDPYHMEPLYTSLGGYIFGTDANGEYDATKLGVGTPESVEAAERIGQLGEKGENVLRRSISGDNSIALFTEGKAAFLVSGPWALPDVSAAGFGFEVQPVPPFKGAEAAEPFMGAQSFMVASNAKNAAFAQEFVSTGVNNEEAMTKLFELGQRPPAMLSVQEGVQDANVKVFAEAANAAAPMPALPAMASVWEPLGKAWSAIVGGADPAKTIKGAGNAIQQAIDAS